MKTHPSPENFAWHLCFVSIARNSARHSILHFVSSIPDDPLQFTNKTNNNQINQN